MVLVLFAPVNPQIRGGRVISRSVDRHRDGRVVILEAKKLLAPKVPANFGSIFSSLMSFPPNAGLKSFRQAENFGKMGKKKKGKQPDFKKGLALC